MNETIMSQMFSRKIYIRNNFSLDQGMEREPTKVIAIHHGWVYEGLNYGPYLTIEEQIALKATTDT